MDLNYILFRHQVSLFKSDNAACDRARTAHRGLADGYAAAILAFRRGLRVPELA